MELFKKELNQLFIGMKQAYSEGKNAMELAWTFLNKYSDENTNHKIAILLAYDLQIGTYVENVSQKFLLKLDKRQAFFIYADDCRLFHNIRV